MTTAASFKSVSRPTRNEAVQFCIDIWRETFAQAKAAGKADYFAVQDAHDGYREAMPDLTSFSEIQDFIACVGRGILIKAIDESEASKLLVAARIASQAFASSEKAVLKAVSQSQAGFAA